MKEIRVLSYNIHKGFSPGNRAFVLHQIKESIRLVQADLVFLQEVLGEHNVHQGRQFEFLADDTWPHFAYGKNAVYTEGHHGNAILSRYPILSWDNIDISTNRLERRGLLHGVIELTDLKRPVHLICVHLGLFEAGRQSQLKAICKRIELSIPREDPLLIAGDFNDWRENATDFLESRLGVTEVHRKTHGHHARTFPSWMPVLRLDRIYSRGFQPIDAICLSGDPWRSLSDHAALFARFNLKKRL